MKKVVLHIFPDSLFTIGYMEMLNKEEKYNHIFILTDIGAKINNRIPKYDNIKVIGKVSSFKLFDFIKLHSLIKGAKYDRLIIHSCYLNYLILAFYFDKKMIKNATLSLWGGQDSKRFEVPSTMKIYTLFGYFYEKIRRKFYKNIKDIAYIVLNDFENVKKEYNIECDGYISEYPFVPNISNAFDMKKHEDINIQICHNGNNMCNTLEVINLLEKFKNDNIKVYASLSYGDKEYIKKVLKKGKEIFGDKFYPLTTIMNSSDYAKYVSNLDVMIVNSDIQQGLGNIYLGFASGVKLYFKKNKILDNKCSKDGYVYDYVSNIKKYDINDLIKISDSDKSKNNKISMKMFDTSNALKKWIRIIERKHNN